MKSYLIPHRFKAVGFFLVSTSILFATAVSATSYNVDWLNTTVVSFYTDLPFDKHAFFVKQNVNLFSTIIGVMFLVGTFMVGFSKLKEEDEFIASIRLASLIWAMWFNYILLLLGFLFVYGLGFISVMVYNMFTVPIIFILRFYYSLYISRKLSRYEK